MLVLGKDLQERVRRQIGANLLERDARPRVALDPKADGGNFVAVREHEIGEIELAIEFEGPRMNGEGAGRRAVPGGFVDDPHLDPELGQPERQNQTGRSSADDQNVAAHHAVLHWTLPPMGCGRRPSSAASLSVRNRTKPADEIVGEAVVAIDQQKPEANRVHAPLRRLILRIVRGEYREPPGYVGRVQAAGAAGRSA